MSASTATSRFAPARFLLVALVAASALFAAAPDAHAVDGYLPSCQAPLNLRVYTRVALPFDVTKACNDPAGTGLTYGQPTSQNRGTITGENGVYSYTSHDFFFGNDTISIPVTSGSATATFTFTMGVLQATPEPICELEKLLIVYGGPPTKPVSGRIVCHPRNGGPVTFRLAPKPARAYGSTVLRADGTFTWTPSPNKPEMASATFQYYAGQDGIEQLFSTGVHVVDPWMTRLTPAKITLDIDTELKRGTLAPTVSLCTGECTGTSVLTVAGPAAKALGLSRRAVPVVVASAKFGVIFQQKEFTPDWRTRQGLTHVSPVLTQTAKAKLAKATKPVVVTQVVTTTDQKGTRKVTRRVVLVP